MSPIEVKGVKTQNDMSSGSAKVLRIDSSMQRVAHHSSEGSPQMRVLLRKLRALMTGLMVVGASDLWSV